MSGVLRYFTGQSDHHLDIADFVNYRKTGRLGFPREPLCSSYDPILGVYYIGTREGHIHVYGWKDPNIGSILNITSDNNVMNYVEKNIERYDIIKNIGSRGIKAKTFGGEWRLGGGNVHLIASLPEGKVKSFPVRIHSIDGVGELMILSHDYSIYKLKIIGNGLHFDTLDLSELSIKVSATSLLMGETSKRMLLGTNTGEILAVDSQKMQIEKIINDVNASSEGEEETRSAITVRDIVTHPNGNQVLVLYDDNRIIVYDVSINETITVISTGDTINFGSNNVLLISYEDGTYQRLENLRGELSKSYQVWGPYPCDPVVKITEAVVNGMFGPVLIFSGGMPTASYGDRNTITLKTEKSLLVLDFPSKVLDFHVSKSPIHGRADQTKYDSVLIVLTEHEIVMVDIRDSQWRELPAQQYFPMDSKQLTTSYFAPNIASEVWAKMAALSSSWWKNQPMSDTDNPFFAYKSDDQEKSCTADQHRRQLLLTGHENGAVNIFTCGEKGSSLLFTVNVHEEFELPTERERTLSLGSNASTWDTETDEEPGSMAVGKDEDEWPPFRKVGLYDQYSDEPGVTIVKLCMDSNSGQFVVSTKCGANFIFELQDNSQTLKPSLISIALIKDPQYQPPKPSPQESLRDPNRAILPREKEKTYGPGYQPCSLKDSLTSFFIQLDPRTPCTTMALLSSRNMVALANEFGFVIYNYGRGEEMLKESYIASEDLMSAVGENMRSLYKSMKKSVRNTFRRKSRSNNKKSVAAAVGDEVMLADEDADDEANYRPVERQIEARNAANPIKTKPHLVKFVCFLRTPISDGTDLTDTFWVGLNAGQIYSYAIEDRPRQSDEIRLDKEIRLSHNAPVIHMGVFMEISNKHALHRLLIVTEEQLRIYALPSMKRSKYKVKLTSTEGLHIKKAIVATVHSSAKSTRAPWIILLTNTGEVRVYSTQSPKIKSRFQVIHHQNHIAIASALLTPFGDILYLRGKQTEFQRATISSHSIKWKEPFQDSTWPKKDE